MVVKNIIFIIVTLSLISCIGYRTDYYKKRIKHQQLSSEDCGILNLIDTTKLYKLVYIKNKEDNQEYPDFNPEYLKFYDECKVGDFYSYNANDVSSLNPERADMGYYRFKDGKLVTKIYFDHPQGGGFLTQKFNIETQNDTLILLNDRKIYKYEIITLPKSFLVFKPDW